MRFDNHCLREAAVRISARPLKRRSHLVDYGVQGNASLFDERGSWRAANLSRGDDARIGAFDGDALCFNADFAEARACQQVAQKVGIVHVPSGTKSYLGVAGE